MKVKSPKLKVKSYFGFTLIEVLVVVSLLGIVMLMTVQLLIFTLRANKKSQSISKIKQSGNYTLRVMERMIRNAQEILDCDSSSVRFQNPDGGITELTCNLGEEGFIASNSVSLTTIGENIDLTSCSFTYYEGLGRRDPDSVEINFRLDQAAGGVIEEKVGLSFETKVSLRNY